MAGTRISTCRRRPARANAAWVPFSQRTATPTVSVAVSMAMVFTMRPGDGDGERVRHDRGVCVDERPRPLMVIGARSASAGW